MGDPVTNTRTNGREREIYILPNVRRQGINVRERSEHRSQAGSLRHVSHALRRFDRQLGILRDGLPAPVKGEQPETQFLSNQRATGGEVHA